MGMQLFASSILNACHVAGKFDDSELHTETNTEERDLVGTCPLDSLDHASGSSGTESTRDENTSRSANGMPSLVEVGRVGLKDLIFQMRRVNPDNFDLLMAIHRRMLQRLRDTNISVLQSGVLANERN